MAKGLTVNKNPGKRNMTGGQSLTQLSKELRELKNKVPVWMPIDGIPVMEEFRSLFRIKSLNQEKIAESIRLNGFDEKFSVIIAVFPDGSQSLIAGYTRRAGALDAGLTEIPAWTQEFPSINAAIEWALHEQYDRRNLSDDEIYESVLRIDEFTRKGTHGFEGKSSVRTADIAGISARKVEQIRTVDSEASDEQKEAIRSGDKSVNRVYQEIAEERKAQRCAPEEGSGPADHGEPEAQDCAPGKVAGSEDSGESRAQCCAPEESAGTADLGEQKAQDCAPPPKRDWSIEIRKSKICLVRKGEVTVLLNYEAMNLIYNGAPEKQLLNAVQEYMEKIL